MNDETQKIIKSFKSQFSEKLNQLIDDFVIRDNKAFVTLKAKNYDDAKKLETLKKSAKIFLMRNQYLMKYLFRLLKKKLKNKTLNLKK